jgi:predicted RNase H-like nuclease (RuvC/YqgF family)
VSTFLCLEKALEVEVQCKERALVKYEEKDKELHEAIRVQLEKEEALRRELEDVEKYRRALEEDREIRNAMQAKADVVRLTLECNGGYETTFLSWYNHAVAQHTIKVIKQHLY